MTEDGIDTRILGAERAIESLSEDALGRDSFVSRLSRVLISETTKKSSGTVVGLVGSWGSGKSSILNLLEEYIRASHPTAVVVRFNPWLISGRNDLIQEFFGALRSEIATSGDKSKVVVKTIVDYGSRLSPILEFIPGVGSAARAVINTTASVLEKGESITNLRKHLLDALANFPEPVVVMIDEVDRVEDAEVKAVAQLVRSIADFQNISYILAYDSHRVAEALGNGDQARGRNYLEKIVQLQIPIPIITAEELASVFRAELMRISDFMLPKGFPELQRYQEMEQLLVTKLLSTLRDVKRFIGTFRAVFALVQYEADWIDVLGYTGLLIKAPATLEGIKRDPDLIVDNPWTEAEHIRRARGKNNKDLDEHVSEIVATSEDSPAVRQLLRDLFPILRGIRRNDAYPDRLSDRRVLLTVLRLGDIPGAWSREAVFRVATLSPLNIAIEFKTLHEEGRLEAFLGRLNELYGNLSGFDHSAFWNGMAIYVRREPPGWQSTYTGMRWRIKEITEILLRWVNRRPEIAQVAKQVLAFLQSRGEIQITAHLLYHHAFAHGLGEKKRRPEYGSFLTLEEAKSAILESAKAWKALHLKGELLPAIWDLIPLFVMETAGVWDAACRERLTRDIQALDEALDGLTIMLFGPGFSMEKTTLEHFVDLEAYALRINQRLASNRRTPPDETVEFSLRAADDVLRPRGGPGARFGPTLNLEPPRTG
jgi:predicted KAP-like P-loop ATPase